MASPTVIRQDGACLREWRDDRDRFTGTSARPADGGGDPAGGRDPAPRPRGGRGLAVRVDRAQGAGQGRAGGRCGGGPRGDRGVLGPLGRTGLPGGADADRRRGDELGAPARPAAEHDRGRVARVRRDAPGPPRAGRGAGPARDHRHVPGAHRHVGLRRRAGPRAVPGPADRLVGRLVPGQPGRQSVCAPRDRAAPGRGPEPHDAAGNGGRRPTLASSPRCGASTCPR